MIYSVLPSSIPQDTIQRICEVKDLNYFTWNIVILSDKFYIRYLGISYFSEITLTVTKPSGESLQIKNHNCFLIPEVTELEVNNYIKLISTNYTDNIWESFEEIFTERFKSNDELLESELWM